MRTYFLLFILVLFLAGCSANAETVIDDSTDSGDSHACPRGVSDDPFPGRCGHYVDNDGNGLCDLGE